MTTKNTVAHTEPTAPLTTHEEEMKLCKKLYKKAMTSSRNALDHWLEFSSRFAPCFDRIKKSKVKFLDEHFPNQKRTIYRALLVHKHEAAVREKIAAGDIVDFMAAHRYASKLKKEAKAAAKGQNLADVVPEEPQIVLKKIEFFGTDKQYLALLSWAKKKNVIVEENSPPVANALENVTPLPKQQQEGDSDHQVAA